MIRSIACGVACVCMCVGSAAADEFEDQKILMDALLSKIYYTITESDNSFPNQSTRSIATHEGVEPEPYVSFAVPGIPVENLNFMAPNTPAKLNEASAFAHVYNMIPSPKRVWAPTNKRVWDIYSLCLDNAVLAEADLSAREKEMLDAAYQYLETKYEYDDPITGQRVTEMTPTINVQKYEDFAQKYGQAYNNYFQVRGDLLRAENVSDDERARRLREWSERGPTLKQQVTMALSQWNSRGRRNRVEQVQGLISQLTARGPYRVWEKMRTNFETAVRSDEVGNSYYPTYVYPPNVLQSQGWTRMTFSMSEVETYKTDDKKSWGGSAGFKTGLWNASANVGYKGHKTFSSADTSDVGFEFEIAQAVLVRPWLNTWIYSNRSWMGGSLIGGDGSISSGQSPPDASGMMPMIPVSMILVRNVKIHLDWSKEKNRTSYEKLQSSASGGFGPFSAKANYSHEKSRNYHYSKKVENGLEIDGAQIIGFVCEVLPKSPWPDRDTYTFDEQEVLVEEDWVYQGRDFNWLKEEQ